MLYPRIPHLAGSSVRPDDLQLSQAQTDRVLASDVRVYEKLDGLNVGFRFRGPGRLRILSRVHGELAPHELGDELAPLCSWALRRLPRLWALCGGTKHIAFGEWLYHRVGVHYPHLSDAVLFFDLADGRGRFRPRLEMERRVRAAGLHVNPLVFVGRVPSLDALMKRRLSFRGAKREGFIFCRGTGRWKYVLKSHVRLRGREMGKDLNGIDGDAPSLV